MTPDQIAVVRGLLGKPYDRDGYTCWHAVEEAQALLFGRRIAVAVPPGLSTLAQMRLIESHPERARWRRAEAPSAGAIVMMTKVAREMHAGVFLDLDGGLVLHCDAPHGVALEPHGDLLVRGFRALRFYEPAP
jgi:hypothetical protein